MLVHLKKQTKIKVTKSFKIIVKNQTALFLEENNCLLLVIKMMQS